MWVKVRNIEVILKSRHSCFEAVLLTVQPWRVFHCQCAFAARILGLCVPVTIVLVVQAKGAAIYMSNIISAPI